MQRCDSRGCGSAHLGRIVRTNDQPYALVGALGWLWRLVEASDQMPLELVEFAAVKLTQPPVVRTTHERNADVVGVAEPRWSQTARARRSGRLVEAAAITCERMGCGARASGDGQSDLNGETYLLDGSADVLSHEGV